MGIRAANARLVAMTGLALLVLLPMPYATAEQWAQLLYS
jgi:hypothetical protein